MKQNLLIILAILLIIVGIICVSLINLQAEKRKIDKENLEYEKYLNKKILGTELATLISKAVDQNEKNKVEKDEKGYYIDNYENSIKIDLKMTTIDKTYPMEEIYNNKIASFVQNFNLINFECTNIEYHQKTGKISRLVFTELD